MKITIKITVNKTDSKWILSFNLNECLADLPESLNYVKVNDRYQSRIELIEKLKHLEKEKQALIAKSVILHEKVKKLIKLDGVAVDVETNDVLVETMAREMITSVFVVGATKVTGHKER